jgi:soluble lytic murein transglycosylase-like protein
MYYYLDEAGTYHFTNRPSTGPWRLFAVYRNFPDVAKDRILRIVRESCSRHGVDHRLVEAVIQVESNFEQHAVSPRGAQGLMQICPATQRELGVDSPFDLYQNIEAGVRYLRQQIDRFGRTDLALAAYNAGPAMVEKHGGIPPFPETKNYVQRVLSLYRLLQGG